MSEKNIQIETSVLLEGDCGECARRLQTMLENKRGIERAHVKGDPPILCLHFDPNLVSLSAVERMAREMGSELSHRYQHCRFSLISQASADAVRSLTHALEARPGVLHASVNVAAATVAVAFDSQEIDEGTLRTLIAKMGFDLQSEPTVPAQVQEHVCDHKHDHGHRHEPKQSASHVGCAHGKAPSFLPSWLRQRWTIILVAAAGLFFSLGWLGETFWNLPANVVWGFYLLAYVAGAYDISTHALPGLLKGRFDTDILMLAAAAGAAFLGHWAEGAFLLFLFALGHAGEHYALDRARHAVDALGELMPKTAHVRRGDELVEVAVDELAVGEHVMVRPGDRIPVDGRVVQGRSAVDQSPITGESVPVDKGIDDEVFAGTINQENALEVNVTKLAQDNTLQRVMQMVAEAHEQKSPTQQLTQKFTARFVPLVLIFTLLAIVVPPSLQWLSWQDSFYRAMLLLVASSPCALALGTPAAVLAGIGQAARNGVLIKGGVHLENLAGVRVLALDKTGTLTEGRFVVTNVEPSDGVNNVEFLSLAAAVEQQSSHPLALAVLREAQERQIVLADVDGLENVVGRGVRSRVDGEVVLVGSLRLFREEAPELLSESITTRVAALEAQGRTVMLVSRGAHLMGLLALADEPRREAKTAMLALRKLGVSTLVMLTGDNPIVAQRIAAEVGVTEVRAGLLPGDKVDAVRELQQRSGRLAMLGDGVNDAPALASADVGIAMGGAGTAVALETADIVLMSDDLSQLPFAVGLARASRNIIQQNLAIALGVILLLVTTSVLGLATLGPTVLLHEGSTVVVILNALRLLRFQPRA